MLHLPHCDVDFGSKISTRAKLICTTETRMWFQILFCLRDHVNVNVDLNHQKFLNLLVNYFYWNILSVCSMRINCRCSRSWSALEWMSAEKNNIFHMLLHILVCRLPVSLPPRRRPTTTSERGTAEIFPICHSSFHSAISTRNKERRQGRIPLHHTLERGERKINVCYLQFWCCCVLLRHTVSRISLSLNVVDSFLQNPKLIKSIYHNYGQPQHFVATARSSCSFALPTSSGQQCGKEEKKNLKSHVCDLLLAFIIFPFTSPCRLRLWAYKKDKLNVLRNIANDILLYNVLTTFATHFPFKPQNLCRLQKIVRRFL